MNTKTQIRILLVDDHPMVREGLRAVLEDQPELTVVAAVSSGELAVTTWHNVDANVALMDVNMPDMTGIEAMEHILRQDPEAKVLLLTSFSDDLRVFEALDKGAMGFVLKNAEISDIVRSIQAAAAGEYTLSPEAIKSLLDSFPRPAPENQVLTQRELEILTLIVQGFRNKDIAARLSVSVSTVKAYTGKIYEKLQVVSRSEAAAKAVREGLVASDV